MNVEGNGAQFEFDLNGRGILEEAQQGQRLGLRRTVRVTALLAWLWAAVSHQNSITYNCHGAYRKCCQVSKNDPT